MDPMRVLAERNGFFTRRDARSAGYADRDITKVVRHRVWVRIRRGYYTFTELWQALDDLGRHRVRSGAVLDSLGDRVALSHVSGVVEHGIDTWGVDLSRVHVTRLDGGPGRIEGDVVHHEGFCAADEVLDAGGRLVLPPERCALEAGSRATNEQALVMLDSLLRRGLVSPEALMGRFELMSHWPFVQHLHLMVRMADARAESVGESRGRYLFWSHGLPAPQLQYAVHDTGGQLVATSDWGWPEHGLLGEFDGRVKYGRLLRPGQDARAVVFAEKQREDRAREASGMGMVRLVWSDFDRPTLTVARVRRGLRLSG
ncbi:type IV toxin-antitoxin system AbiEi family antitoxin domain-containing protein [Nocardioides sp. Arc9.136]|uniref:type IV toxin-antitoxin system AbiEi family antitoxin domain-containing protein n=1 Tax=Nocardioides sp. Arc9.136 TaxID=2996826 RepID=UPI002665A0A4|nr:type IV toxin-antitoxin system AbiEi family antitoxin domain-containing protein [Nocardioides sp. Arc9.136]WKN50382.1 type IV toxin-antitoxin system AbiEi family antitoxin domain-containing protein [Nocardioides sp. Arc9.136]